MYIFVFKELHYIIIDILESMKKTTTNKNSTIAIDHETSKRLEKYCNIYGLSKKEYSAASLDYFELTEVNLLEFEIRSKNEEFELLNKKLDDKFELLSQQNENTRTDNTLVKKQNETIFTAMQSIAEAMQQIKTTQEEANRLLLESTTKPIVEPKKKWWQKK